MSTRKNRSRRGRSYLLQNLDQKKKSRERKDARESRHRNRKRAQEIQKLEESNHDMPMMEIICQTKRGFLDRVTALLCKPRADLSIYECDICMGFHYTSQKQKGA